MGGWQPLPDELPAEVRHFVEQLRLLKDRTGLSLVALGARTAYSKSSWHRYLNATQPPPRQAVLALCRVAGVDSERIGVRWELAVQAWPRPEVSSAKAEGAGGDEYREDPTLPWWDTPPEKPEKAEHGPGGRLLRYALVLLLLMFLMAVAGVVVLG
ncbi:helix-turn-helix domain-containing protein [Streptomyces prunicolor]|jgi:hypothetical protein|uniref:helix-turn-helix domain-containing protein n=1 Tax=Streptomyces prunicolor TaxID=67348 RepID=UPI0037D2E252